jgi:hypothetical protein
VPGPFLGRGSQLLHHGRYDEPDPNQPEQLLDSVPVLGGLSAQSHLGLLA